MGFWSQTHDLTDFNACLSPSCSACLACILPLRRIFCETAQCPSVPSPTPVSHTHLSSVSPSGRLRPHYGGAAHRRASKREPGQVKRRPRRHRTRRSQAQHGEDSTVPHHNHNPKIILTPDPHPLCVGNGGMSILPGAGSGT